ncbi:hypothetical protein V1638_04115 [Pseudarthrobacter sp. J64]|uniref:hypothetical protein n=1 Tax=Pseudarthrobacter sp. J64 TaxID=3116485 RepID=UPI002E804768|nr:hypothetical protein [Pseudarthrobacter sp. J64]MEE2568582.1 hypothetical protein [Pseudarthrobacter sp. J64]
MSRRLVECFAVVQPMGRKPFREKPELRFRENRDLQNQLATFAKNTWYPRAGNVVVEVRRKTVEKQVTITGEIIVDKIPVARYSLHPHVEQPMDQALPGVGK